MGRSSRKESSKKPQRTSTMAAVVAEGEQFLGKSKSKKMSISKDKSSKKRGRPSKSKSV